MYICLDEIMNELEKKTELKLPEKKAFKISMAQSKKITRFYYNSEKTSPLLVLGKQRQFV